MMKPVENGRRFTDDIFKSIFFDQNVFIFIQLSLNCVYKGPIDNESTLV